MLGYIISIRCLSILILLTCWPVGRPEKKMTKQEAKAIIDAGIAKNKKIANINEAHNEGGEGYEVDYDFSAYEKVNAAGYAVHDNEIYDREDFEALRKKWNDACIALKGQKVNIGIIAAKSGVNPSLLETLKRTYSK